MSPNGRVNVGALNPLEGKGAPHPFCERAEIGVIGKFVLVVCLLLCTLVSKSVRLLPKTVKQRCLSQNWEIELCEIQRIYSAANTTPVISNRAPPSEPSFR